MACAWGDSQPWDQLWGPVLFSIIQEVKILKLFRNLVSNLFKFEVFYLANCKPHPSHEVHVISSCCLRLHLPWSLFARNWQAVSLIGMAEGCFSRLCTGHHLGYGPKESLCLKHWALFQKLWHQDLSPCGGFTPCAVPCQQVLIWFNSSTLIFCIIWMLNGIWQSANMAMEMTSFVKDKKTYQGVGFVKGSFQTNWVLGKWIVLWIMWSTLGTNATRPPPKLKVDHNLGNTLLTFLVLLGVCA